MKYVTHYLAGVVTKKQARVDTTLTTTAELFLSQVAVELFEHRVGPVILPEAEANRDSYLEVYYTVRGIRNAVLVDYHAVVLDKTLPSFKSLLELISEDQPKKYRLRDTYGPLKDWR